MCTHGVQTLPCGFLCCFLCERPRLAVLLLLPNASSPPPPHAWRFAHLRSARQKAAGSERWMAGTSRCRPLLFTPLLPTEEEWVNTANFTCYATLVFIARVFASVFYTYICICLPTDSDFYLGFMSGSDTDIVHITCKRENRINIHKKCDLFKKKIVI